MGRLPPLALNAWLRYDAIQRAFDVVPAGARVLEIGAGQGAVGARLARYYRYTGIEPDPASAAVAQARIEAHGGRFRQCLSSDLPRERFTVVCAFEVLEHMEDDRGALLEWISHIEPDGFLILSTPAFQARFGPWDTRAGHYRRYEPAAMRGLLRQAGLRDPETWVSGFPLGLALEQGRNLLGRLRPKAGRMEERTLASGRAYQPPAVFGLATQTVTLPFRWLQRPFARTTLGTGLVARGRRPSA